jgi:chromosome segregation ATPase
MAKGPSGEELKNIKNSLRELEQLYAKLGGTNPFQGMSNKNIASSVDEVTKLKNTLEDAREAVSDMDGEAGDLFKSWKAITDEVKGYRGTINDSKSSVSKVNDLAQKLKDHHSKINVLSSKDLSNVKSKLEQSKSTLKINQTSLQSTIDELTAQKSNN